MSHSMNNTRRWSKLLSSHLAWITIVLLCMALFLPGLFQVPVTDVDEARFAQASKQMVETQDYWHINIQNKPRHLKPPAIYWLQSFITQSTQSAPYNQIFSYRLPSFFAATTTTLLIFLLYAASLGRKTAFIASVVFASTLIVAFESSFSTTDACLMLSIFVMQWALGQIYLNHRKDRPNHARWPVLFWGSMAVGIFLKGIAPIFAIGTIVALCLFDRQWRWTRALHPALGLLGVLLLTLSWLIPFSLASHSNFLWDMISQDVVHKVTGGQEGHGQPMGFYLLLMPLLFWPMSLYFTTAFNYAKQQWQNPTTRFLLAWILPNWLIYELIPTKLIHYLMPIFPAIALLIAISLLSPFSQSSQRKARYFEACLWFFCNVVLALGVAFFPYSLTHQISFAALAASLIILINMLMAYRYFRQQHHLASLTCNALTAIIIYTLLFSITFPNLTLLWNSQRVAKLLQLPNYQEQIADHPLLVSGYHEPSLIFEVGTQSVAFTPLDTIEKSYASNTGSLALLGKKDFQRFQTFAQQHDFHFKVDAILPGYNLNHGKHIILRLIEPLDKEST